MGLFQDIFDYGEICAVQDAVENCPPLAPYVTGGPYIPGNGSACNPEGVIVEEVGLNIQAKFTVFDKSDKRILGTTLYSPHYLGTILCGEEALPRSSIRNSRTWRILSKLQ